MSSVAGDVLGFSRRFLDSLDGWQRALAAAALVVGSGAILRRLLLPKWLDASPDDFVLITGASSGIGRTTALYLADEVGFSVFAAVRKESDADSLLASAKHKERLVPIILDVTNESDIASAVRFVEARVGARGLRALFNNAGISIGGGPLELSPLSMYRRVFETNFFGVVAVTQAFLPLLRRAKGVIVQNSSLLGIFGSPFSSHYVASKFALEGLSDSLRRELALHNVRVVVVEPGFIKSEIAGKGRSTLQENEQLFRNSVYPEFWPYRQASMKQEAAVAESPMLVARIVEEAIRSPNARPRYLVGGESGIVSVLRYAPDALVDALWRRRIRAFSTQ